MTNSIAVINAGSSSVKFAIYDAEKDERCSFRGQVEGIGVKPRLKVADDDGRVIEERDLAAHGFDHAAATREIVATGRVLLKGGSVIAFGHRVVHGGVKYDAPARVTEVVLNDLAELEPLAPLHQPHNLAPIRAIMKAAPQIPQIACFDTAFHRSQSGLAQAFALPRSFREEGVRRYGFHGLSYEFLVSRFRELAPDLADERIVFAHLGNGASLCAVKDGRSVASTMGFTAVDGLMMGTRCGSIDPGVILFMMQRHGMDAAAIEDVIYKKSGLLGVSGISSDMRALRDSSDPAAGEAIALFVYRIVRELGSLVAALGGLDALVFSAGIGEHDPATRAEVVEGSRWTGAILDPARNQRSEGLISADRSPVAVWVIPTDEERLIARHTAAVLRQPEA
ncbi:MAG: acetate/propionate family kinase [Hyphomicrobiales bacterium]|nr:acetate/propionate family kinase [Hyphomicrobiales bacterium]